MANKPISTPNVTMGRHGRIHEQEAAREKGVTFEKQEAEMARPKSETQTAKHEEDALRTQAVTESRQKEMDQPENRGSKEAMDRNITFGEPHPDARQAAQDREAEKSRTMRAQLDHVAKVDPKPEPAAKKAPTAKEINEQVNEEIRPKDGLPGHGAPKPDPLLGLMGSIMLDDVQSVLSDLYAHNDIGERRGHIVQVKVGGGFIEIDINKLNRCANKTDLRAYISSLLVL